MKKSYSQGNTSTAAPARHSQSQTIFPDHSVGTRIIGNNWMANVGPF